MIVSDEGIKLGLYGGKIIGAILGNVDGITLLIDVGTKLGSLDSSFDGSNDRNIEGLFLGGSLVSTDNNTLALYLELYKESQLVLML